MSTSAPERETALTPEALEALYAVKDDVFLRVSMVMSIDGATAVDGDSRALSSPGDQQVYRLLREHADLILIGSKTARHPAYAKVKTPIAIVTNSGAIEVPKDRSTMVITNRQGAERVPNQPEIAVIQAGEDRVDLRACLTQLHDRGFSRILCEGGPTLLSSLHQEALIDELCLTLSPLIAGGDSSPLLSGGGVDPSMTLRHVIVDSSHLMLRYSRLGS
jgi:riboflavin biosynthesis pyrimidine reductase